MTPHRPNKNKIFVGKSLILNVAQDAPTKAGVYQMINDKGRNIYIGKAKNLKNRLKQYTSELEGKTAIMVEMVYSVKYTVTQSETDAFLLEAQLIKKFKPKFNILLKDDKSFPYIKLRLDHKFPQLLKYRGKDLKDGKFFGPFASAKQVEITLNELQKIFKLRSCSDNYFASRTRPCLQYQIDRCCAPCVNKISYQEYNELVNQVKTFLSGKNKLLQGVLATQMQKLSDNLNFELAAKIRDRIKALSYIQLKAENSGITEDADILAISEIKGQYCVMFYIYRAGQACGHYAYFPENTKDYGDIADLLEKFILQLYQNNLPAKNIILNHDIENKKTLAAALQKLHKINIKISFPKLGVKNKLVQIATENANLTLQQKIKSSAKNIQALEDLKKIFNLNKVPTRIEIYDNSHIQGAFPVGAMVVVGQNGFEKKEYRLFNIKGLQTEVYNRGDDYAMLKEVLTRRFTRLQKDSTKMPDFIIIDGGKGHLSVVEKLLDKFQLDINFVCMSKGINRNAGEEQFHRPNTPSFTLDKNLPIMKYLQILRDEVHNFAINTHRKKRSKAIRASSLDNIPGIGNMRKKALLNYFGSFDSISGATIDELAKIDGISKELAKKIHTVLQKIG